MASVLPYMLFTFLPAFIFRSIPLPVFGNYTLYFLLLLPLVFTYILTKQNMRFPNYWQINPLSNIFVLSSFIFTMDLVMFHLLQIPFWSIYILDYCLLILVVFYDLLFSAYMHYRQKKMGTTLDTLHHEKLDLFNQLLLDNQLEQIGMLIFNILENIIHFNGAAIACTNRQRHPFFLVRTGALSEIPMAFIESESLATSSSKLFMYNNLSCLSISLVHLHDTIGFIILSRDVLSAFSQNELITLKNYSQAITDILVTSFWMAEQQREKQKPRYSESERLAYFKQIDFAEKDKRNLSIYLHDEILQEILAVKNLVSVLHGTPEILRMIDTSLDTVTRSLRQQMFELYPSFLSVTPLSISLESLINSLNTSYQKSLSLRLDLPDEASITQEEKQTLYRILKELMTNVFKHADATLIRIALYYKDKKLFLSVQDNGCGMCLDSFSALTKNHLGLISIKQDITFRNGQFNIISAPKQGTCIEITFPRKETEDTIS
ncbi:MAG: ATP-binding protein, partial [Eubacterium sp.]